MSDAWLRKTLDDAKDSKDQWPKWANPESKTVNDREIIHKFVDFACRVRPLLEETLEAYPLQSERDQFAGREQACLNDLLELLDITKEKK